MTPRQIYEESILDIDAITDLVNHPAQARNRLMETKSKWIALARDHRGSEVDRIMQQALTSLPKANTAPASWGSQLYDTRGDFTFALSHVNNNDSRER